MSIISFIGFNKEDSVLRLIIARPTGGIVVALSFFHDEFAARKGNVLKVKFT